MGSAASCAERPSTPLDERLRTMLIMRAYNCRPRDWTMEDQFDAVAENGFLTKDNLRTALQLAECPRIGALLDRCNLFDPPVVGSADQSPTRSTTNPSAAGVGSISVADLIAFVEEGGRHRQNSCPSQQRRRQRLDPPDTDVGQPSPQQSPPLAPPPSPSQALPASNRISPSPKWPGNPHRADERFSTATTLFSTPTAQSDARSGMPPPEQPLSPAVATSSFSAPIDATGSESAEAAVDSSGVGLLSPRVVPLTSRSALSPSSAAWSSKRFGGGSTGTSTRAVRRERTNSVSGQNPVSSRPGETMGQRALQGGANEEAPAREKESSKRGGGHCTMLVRHLGAVLGLRGREAYRRPGPGQPVWRKRETLIQERIVQYTTLDEEGTIQELCETEKSQTEVLHMECKRTGEFAHSESTHYESGEAFNGEVVLEETGVERYVHLRSVDDEYEHLESTLPNRARNGGGGGAAGGVGGSPPAEGVESGPGANENGGDVDTVVEGGDSDGRSSAGAEAGQGRNHRGMRDGRGGVNGGSEQNSGTPSESSGQEKPERPGGDGDQCQASSASPSAPPEEQRIEPPCRGDDDAGLSDAFPRDPADTSFARSYLDTENDAAPGDTDDRGLPSPSPPPSAYHYRSPSCSPRLSPRPMRSPYRQEGVGGRESSGRGESARQSGKPCERRGEAERPACSPAGDGGDAVRRGRHAGRSAHVAGAGGQAGAAVGENNDAKTDEGEERGHERQEEWGSSARVLRSCPGALPSPLPGPAPAQGDGDDRGAGSRGSGGDGLRPDAWPDAEPFRQSTATKVDRTEGGAFTGGGGGGGLDGGGIEGARLASSGEFADEYEGSVILIDNRSHAGGGGGEGGPDDSSARLEEEWWQPESGSALRGVDFAFDKGDSAAKSLGKEVGALPSCAEPPTISVESTPSPTRPSRDNIGDNIDVTRFVDGLLSASPPPTMSNRRDQAENSGHGEAALERKNDVSLGADGGQNQEPTASAPFHSQGWGSKATSAAPYEDGEEEKLTRVGAVASGGRLGPSSGPDVAA